MEIKKLLIANRGEIALRIIRSAHKMGISTVALITKAEAGAQHARLADETIEIGLGPSKDSFLSIEKIIDAGLKTGAHAIHPGYGFLSQSVEFVKEAEKNGLVFVGPSASAMQKMGSKSWSKRIMSESGVPVIQGYHGDNQDPNFLLERATEIGFPVMIKATMGGGGKGMRLSHSPSSFLADLDSAKNEARGAFGDDEVIIEKFVVDPKHIEIQVIADNFGNTFHLFERDCSIQRRHQKIIEEGPSTVAPDIVRQIREMGVQAAKSVGYSNAGTVEFLYEHRTGRFYFMEMNTRLQVEHPVSEMITGVDIVELQLRVARGESLKGLKLPEQPQGHAIEARICAEDPFNGFLPTTGRVSSFEFQGKPVTDSSRTMGFDLGTNRSNVRLDTAVIQGSQITPFYDSMIGKLIVFGRDRPEALSLLESSLKSLKISGVQTNVPFLLNLFKEANFLGFNYSLEYFEKNQELLLQEPKLDYRQIFGFLALAKLMPGDCGLGEASLVGFRNNMQLRKMYRFRVEKAYSLSNEVLSAVVSVSQTTVGGRTFEIVLEVIGQPAETFEVELVEKQAEKLAIRLGNHHYNMSFYTFNEQQFFYQDGVFYKAIDCTFDSVIESVQKSASNLVRAPMPGTITAINCKDGDVVKKGTPIVTIEAMKMEHKVLAAANVRIKKINFEVKEFVEMGALIIETEPIN